MWSLKWSPESIENAYQEGLEAYRKKEYGAAGRPLAAAARRGHREAQYLMGRIGEAHKDLAAVRWYEKAAEQGHLEAQRGAARLYEFYGFRLPLPKGGPERKAFYWHKKAAEQGDPGSMGRLGALYLTGRGTEENQALGLQWLEKAARLGNCTAQFQCAECYDKGLGTEPDERAALYWYECAAGAPSQTLSRKSTACFQCGLRYFVGRGTRRDYEKALAWFAKAAGCGCPEACCYCGACCAAMRDIDTAMDWFTRGMHYQIERARRADTPLPSGGQAAGDERTPDSFS